MDNCPLVWIIIGVSGSGKTTLGRLFAKELECDFLEGDRRHPRANILKMIAQQPLQEEDRLPWLLEIEDDLQRAIDRNRELVMTCSALKKSYREEFTSLGRVQLVWLKIERSVLEQRLQSRPGHYMSVDMLSSQIDAFESILPEENVMIVDGSPSIDVVMGELMTKATQKFPSITKPWWERCME
jgi:gluconokinase